MQTILIQSDSKATQKLIIDLAKVLGNKVKVIENSILEDILFGSIIEEAKTNTLVPKDKIIKLLRK
jgi:hypothetical protein